MDQSSQAADRRRIRWVVIIASMVIVAAVAVVLLVRDDGTSDPNRAAGSATTQTAQMTQTAAISTDAPEVAGPLQIIGELIDGPAKPFALVERFFDSDRPPSASGEPVTIDGDEVFIGTFPNGNGEATWNLPDGSQGHLRSRGLDLETLVSIMRHRSPRC